MKSLGLIEKKNELLIALANLEKEIAEATKKLDEKSLSDFITKGVMSRSDGYHIEKMLKRRQHLQKLDKHINREIGKARKEERLDQLKEKEKTLLRITGKHERLNKKGYDLRVRLKDMGDEGRELNEKERAVRGEISTHNRPDITSPLKLTKDKIEVAKFLKENFVADEQELRDLMQKARDGNRVLLRHEGLLRPIGMKRENVHLGYMLKLDKDSGKILKAEPIARSLSGTWSEEQILEVT